MRFVPRPVYRYSDPDSGLVDGALFAFAARRTNPDLILVVELRSREPTGSEWKYALVRMTDAELSVRLDGKQVWTSPWVDGPKRCDTWVYCWALTRPKLPE